MHSNSSQASTLVHQGNIKTFAKVVWQEITIKDLHVFAGWLQAHAPFAGYDPDRLVSVSTGIVADTSVNCDNAVKLGLKAASEMSGKKFTNITLHRSDKVNPIGAKDRTVKIRGQQVEVNSTQLFNRITYVLNNSSEMETLLAYELAPQLPSLFKDGIMRKPAKKALGDVLKSFSENANLPENGLFVLVICFSQLFGHNHLRMLVSARPISHMSSGIMELNPQWFLMDTAM